MFAFCSSGPGVWEFFSLEQCDSAAMGTLGSADFAGVSMPNVVSGLRLARGQGRLCSVDGRSCMCCDTDVNHSDPEFLDTSFSDLDVQDPGDVLLSCGPEVFQARSGAGAGGWLWQRLRSRSRDSVVLVSRRDVAVSCIDTPLSVRSSSSVVADSSFLYEEVLVSVCSRSSESVKRCEIFAWVRGRCCHSVAG